MDIPDSIVKSGLDQAWSRLAHLDPENVCLRSGADYDPQKQCYALDCFQQPITVCLEDRTIRTSTEVGGVLTSDLAELFNLSLVWYLVQSRDAVCSGRLVHPTQLPGGDMFAKGTHILPLDRVASRYGEDPGTFAKSGKLLHASPLDLGDAALELWPFPRVPVTLVLWLKDEEFPARTTLLLDSTGHLHLPMDILWSTAMFTLQLMLRA
jgi:hypothetical protein